MPHTVALALSDGVPIFELAAPCAIFGTDRSELAGSPWYDFRVCGPPEAAVDRWFRAATPYGYDDLIAADTVIVPACHDQNFEPPDALVDAVRASHENGARIVSICTGAFVLAKAGLLDGRRCTTHWMHAAELQRRHPHLTVDPAVLYVDEGRVLTSAGKAAGSDLCLHIVRTDYNATVANAVARRLVTAPHREGGQAQFVTESEPASNYDPLAPAMQWALERIDQPLSVEDLAGQANMTVRTLHRHFRARVGTNPLNWLQHQRVLRAQQLLEQSTEKIDAIAHKSGFGTGTALRRHFRRSLDITPEAYRRTFAAAKPGGER